MNNQTMVTIGIDMGGIAGSCGTTNINGNILNCYNTGEIKGYSCIGGICGYKKGLNIKNCYNTGRIYGINENVAGILGCANNSNSYDESITNCYNTGDIICDNDRCAGIVADISGNYRIAIERCFNVGNIQGKNYCSGILGDDNCNSVQDCFNTGNIQGQHFIGGICGSRCSILERNYNMGKIEGKVYVGGICGYSDDSNFAINGCYYKSEVADYGIGYPQSNSGCAFGTRDEIIQQIEALDGYKTDEYNINQGYPILSWQTDNDKLNLINGDNAFIEDTNGINNGFPILAWQDKASN